ncbi:MAG: hypothetical protein VX294_06435 [Candidatus Latescibacterota bacterium]|nr:hypothetical protein [Candidatus Latescibacterota bacterium]
MTQIVFWVCLVCGCGQVDRSNPSDPVTTQGRVSFSLLANFSDLDKGDLVDRIVEIRYELADLGSDAVLRGTMDLVGATGRVRLNNVETTLEKSVKIEALDAGGIVTFVGLDTLNLSEPFDGQVGVPMERLKGSIEVITVFPTEVVRIEIFGGSESDTLLGGFSMSGRLEQIINDVPTGSDQPFLLKGYSAESLVIFEKISLSDIREGLLARLTVEVVGGGVQIVAHFPSYLPTVEVDRFSDDMGLFFRRSENESLPGPNEPIDFDTEPFFQRGFGPNGEIIGFYNFDVRPRSPGLVYEFVDRRGYLISDQLPVFDRVPGQKGYSDFWLLNTVRIDDVDFIPNSITSVEDILQGEWEITIGEIVEHCVMVPTGSRARKRFSSTQPTLPLQGWYAGQIVNYLLFENRFSPVLIDYGAGEVNTPQMYAFLENNRDELDGFALEPGNRELTHNVATRLPNEEGYSPLWVLQLLTLGAFDRVTDLSSALNQLLNEENLITVSNILRVNAPIVEVEIP